MGNLTIRNLDDAVIARLKARASAHHRSLEAELRELLSRASYLSPRIDDGIGLDPLVEARRISAMTPKGVVQTDSTLLIREDRDR